MWLKIVYGSNYLREICKKRSSVLQIKHGKHCNHTTIIQRIRTTMSINPCIHVSPTRELSRPQGCTLVSYLLPQGYPWVRTKTSCFSCTHPCLTKNAPFHTLSGKHICNATQYGYVIFSSNNFFYKIQVSQFVKMVHFTAEAARHKGTTRSVKNLKEKQIIDFSLNGAHLNDANLSRWSGHSTKFCRHLQSPQLRH